MSDIPHIELPLSKSILTRAITISALSGCAPVTSGVSEDTDFLAGAFSELLTGCRNRSQADIYIGDGAAPLRFFIAAAASMKGCKVNIEGSQQLSRRPHHLLIDALRQAGANISTTDNSFPIQICGSDLCAPDVIEIDSSLSSQYVSAIMMAAPLWTTGATIRMTGNRHVSQPYLHLTAEMMRRAGADVSFATDKIFVKPGHYDPAGLPCNERDWSAASYFYEYTALTGQPLLLDELTPACTSLQGDAECASLFEKIGVKTVSLPDALRTDRVAQPFTSPFEADMTDTPDLVPALAVALTLSATPFSLHGVAHLQHKESNRLEALRSGLMQLGAKVGGDNDTLTFSGQLRPIDKKTPVIFNTHGDHRIAMAFAIAGFKGYNIRLDDIRCIAKSFPDFSRQLLRLQNVNQNDMQRIKPL